MNLRGIELGPCLDASGLRGLDGRTGYWFHYLLVIGKLWFNFTGSTPVGKTMTEPPTEGNMPLKKKYPFLPMEWFPKCIWVSLWHGIALNFVGLTNPGAEVLLRYDQPIVISFMSIAKTHAGRLAEARAFTDRLAIWIAKRPGVKIVLQLNVSCPNAGHDPADLLHEALLILGIVEVLGIPVMVKVNVLAPVEMVRDIAAHSACDALVCSNTVPFGQNPEGFVNQIDWARYFPDGVSPLTKRGFGSPGGASGAVLLPLVAEWIRTIRAAGIDKPINAGGGILKPSDVDTLVRAGLRRGIDSVFISSIAFLRPWNIRSVIRRAHEFLG